MKLKQIFGKTIAAMALVFAIGTVAHAQNASTWFALPGTTPASTSPLTMFDLIANSSPETDGSRLFSLDLLYGDDVATTSNVDISIHFNSSKIEFVNAENVQSGASQSPLEANLTQISYPDYTTLIGSAPASANDAATNALIYPVWAAFGGNVFAAENDGTLDAPTRLLTLNLKWLPNAEGNSNIALVDLSTGIVITDRTVHNIAITGPEVAQKAKLTLDPRRLDEVAAAGADSEGTATLTCTLQMGAAGAETDLSPAPATATNCVVAAPVVTLLDGTAATSPTDYEISPAVATTIAISANAISGDQIYTVTRKAEKKLSIKFTISEISGGVTVAAGSDAIDATKTIAELKVVTAGIAVTTTDASGACTTSDGTSVALSAEGESVNVCLALLSDPGGDVTVSCPSTGGLAVSPNEFMFNNANRETGQVLGIELPADDVAAGSSTVMLECTAIGPGDYAEANEVKQSISVSVTDPDEVSSVGLLAATATISEKGGEQPIMVTASIEGPITMGNDCTVSVSVGTSTVPTNAVADDVVIASGSGTGYAGTLAVGDITIAASTLSGDVEALVTPDEDENEMKEVIPFSASGNCSGKPGATTATNFNNDNAYTLIVDKGGAESLVNVNLAVVPVVAQFGLASAMGNIEARANAPRSGARFSLAGNDSAQGTLLEHMKGAAALEDPSKYEYDWKSALSSSSFSMPISGLGGATLWASGDYRTLNGNNGVTDWKGNVLQLNFGADTRLNNDMLVGAMVSLSESDVNYDENSLGTNVSGEYALTGLSLRPYFSWATGATDIWGSIGFGTGEVELNQVGDELVRTSDTTESSLSLGIKQGLVEGLSIKADIALNTTEVDEKTDSGAEVMAQEIESQRARLLLVGENAYNSANGTITPNIELGFRFDSTESDKGTTVADEDFATAVEDTSTGTEAAMGVDFANAATGVTLSVKARFYSGNDYDEWGISGLVEKKTDPSGLGLALSMRPTYGDTASQVRSLYEQEFESPVEETETAAGNVYAASMDSSIGYGFAVPGSRGVLTPYAKAVLGGDVANKHTLGLRWKPHSRFNIDVYGEDHSAADDYRMVMHWANKDLLDFTLTGERSEGEVIKHSLVLKGTLDF